MVYYHSPNNHICTCMPIYFQKKFHTIVPPLVNWPFGTKGLWPDKWNIQITEVKNSTNPWFGNSLWCPDKGDIQIMEVRLRGVGLYMVVFSSIRLLHFCNFTPFIWVCMLINVHTSQNTMIFDKNYLELHRLIVSSAILMWGFPQWNSLSSQF